MDLSQSDSGLPLISDHRRQWRNCMYVYPVVSRRSRGLSIGINLNPEKTCNFSCLYCQVNRHVHRELQPVDFEILEDELCLAIEEALSGRIWCELRFSATPAEMRRVNDIAFSGDGEPTCLAGFDQAVQVAANVRRQFKHDDIKLVVITNATNCQTPQFQRALPILDANNGEIWAKLDAGTEDYFRAINRPRAGMTLGRIVDGIISVAQDRPIIIQTLLFRLQAQAPPPGEIKAYCERLRQILDSGGRLKAVQIHTIARAPASEYVSPLTNLEMDELGAVIGEAIGPVPVEVFYGADVQSQAK